ncbi:MULTISPECIES: hypothetical protein [Bacillus]|uniref:Cthe-2314-like HEPN domain-containing protein n=1 Tax=Bacillus sonorensis TaxID=119858 RepID=A0ABN5ACG7_9BACI|nr:MULTISPECIES: hypothetical protein [Bacillus]ASB88411.1 hypothetical protein S101395_01903 [Bacillus sonorensis]NWN81132.1 hypothetical protein [Bacillus sp. (in: firmicutes)]RHJ05893.1 hypothetical protein DW143_21335 [Bacillus sonorensis]GIN67656.1 hypothetical protein J41TS2_30770 [Bacillus sonorensis]
MFIVPRGHSLTFYLMVLSPLNDFIEYLNEVEDRFELTKLRFEKEAKGLNPDEEEKYWDYYIDQYHSYDKTYPSILRSSVFTNIYSFLEFHLISLCSDKEMLKRIKFDKGIFKAKKYLKMKYKNCEVFNQAEIFSNDTWAKLVEYSKIRNCIVHNSGILDMIPEKEKRKDLIQIVNKMSHVEFDEHQRIQILSKEFCEDFHEVTSEFICNLNNLLCNLND